MAETAAHLVDHVLPSAAMRQWVLSVPKRLRWHLHHQPGALDAALRIGLDAIERDLRTRCDGAATNAYSGPRNQDTGLSYAAADFEGIRDVEGQT